MRKPSWVIVEDYDETACAVERYGQAQCYRCSKSRPKGRVDRLVDALREQSCRSTRGRSSIDANNKVYLFPAFSHPFKNDFPANFCSHLRTITVHMRSEYAIYEDVKHSFHNTSNFPALVVIGGTIYILNSLWSRILPPWGSAGAALPPLPGLPICEIPRPPK